jgi:hypothetical protein
MRGAVNFVAVFGRLRRQVHSGVVDVDSTPGMQIITPLDIFFSKHRSFNSHIPFFSLDASCRKVLYVKAAQYYL